MRTAVVTGASRGLGLVVASLLEERGMTVTDLSRTSGFDLTQTTPDIDADILVHCVGGTLGIRDPLAPPSDFAAVWELNVGTAIGLNRVVIPKMAERGWGRVVHVSSSAAVLLDSTVAYSAAKAYLNAYVKALARQYASSGVVISAVQPGPFVTPGGHWDADSPKRRDLIAKRMSTGRLATGREVAEVVAFLCSEQASYCAGSVFPADGGMR